MCSARVGRYCLVQLDGSIMVRVFHTGTFLLNASMRLVFSFHAPVAIQSTQVLTWTYSPLGYLSFHHHFILNLSSLGHPKLTVKMVPSGNKSTS
jgi:hypothetical protein